MNDHNLAKAFRLGIIMAETAYKVEKVGTTDALKACLRHLEGVANGEWSTYGSWNDIIPHKGGEPLKIDEVMTKVASENRAAERRIAAAILANLCAAE